MKKNTLMFYLFLFLYSCTPSSQDCNCEEINNNNNIIENNTSKSDFKNYTSSFKIRNYEYSDSLRSEIIAWHKSLPKEVKDSLLDKSLIIQKNYFLSNIILKNEEKVEDIKNLNQKIENHLSMKTGYIQGIPTVLFTTSIEDLSNSPLIDKETLVIQINKLEY